MATEHTTPAALARTFVESRMRSHERLVAAEDFRGWRDAIRSEMLVISDLCEGLNEDRIEAVWDALDAWRESHRLGALLPANLWAY
jgi:hypothetical protein